MSIHAAKHLQSIIENVNSKYPITKEAINENTVAFTKLYIQQTILEASEEKLRSAEVPESRVGYKEPSTTDSDIKLDDNGGYVGTGKDTYYKLDKGSNTSNNDEDLTGSKQNWIESTTGKEAAPKDGITESGMEAGDLPDYEEMTRTGGSTSTPDEPDEKTMKKIGAKAPNIDEHRNNRTNMSRKDAAKAIANVFKKIN